MKSDYQYSANVVYNSFPWPSPSEDQKKKIEQAAQAILDARASCSGNLAELYDPLLMPKKLSDAHNENNRAVMHAYGFDVNKTSEAACVSELMKMYQELA